jgi:uncharacterized protein
MIIDCHTHYGIGWVDRDGDNASQWLEIPAQYNIRRFFLFGHYNLVRQDKVQEDNNRLAKLAQTHPENFIPVASVFPQNGSAALEEVQRCFSELGIRVLKFHPWIQGFNINDPVFLQICELAGELNMPVIFHDGTPPYTLPEQISGLARCRPKTTFVLGHSGILWSWRSALQAMRRQNIWLTLCGPHMRAFEIFCAKGDTDRILWGSDYGFGFSDPYSYRLNELLQAKINDQTKEKILGINPLRLLNE